MAARVALPRDQAQVGPHDVAASAMAMAGGTKQSADGKRCVCPASAFALPGSPASRCSQAAVSSAAGRFALIEAGSSRAFTRSRVSGRR